MEWVQYLKRNYVPFEDMPYNAQVSAKAIGKENFKYLESGFCGWETPTFSSDGFCGEDIYRLDPDYKHSEIEITVKVNGKQSKLSDISEETLLEIRKGN